MCSYRTWNFCLEVINTAAKPKSIFQVSKLFIFSDGDTQKFFSQFCFHGKKIIRIWEAAESEYDADRRVIFVKKNIKIKEESKTGFQGK